MILLREFLCLIINQTENKQEQLIHYQINYSISKSSSSFCWSVDHITLSTLILTYHIPVLKTSESVL